MPRKQKTIHYLYKTTCLITGRYYIGMHSTCDLDDGYMGSGKRLRRSIRKYGEENHVKEILQFFESRELLVEAEKKAITEEMLRDVNCMNLKEGGTGGNIGRNGEILGGDNFDYVHSVYWKDEVNLNRMKERSKKLMKLRWQNDDFRNLVINLKPFQNKKHSDETKQKMSNSKKGSGVGEKNSQFGTMWITNGQVNRKVKKDESMPEGWFSGRKIL
jgi:hypothetical protein